MLKRKTLCIILSFGLMMHTGLASALAASINISDSSKLLISDIPEVISVQEVRDQGFVERMKDEETINSVVFRDANGMRTAYYFGSPIKYASESGEFRDKSTQLTSFGLRADYAFSHTSDRLTTVFPEALNESTPIVFESGEAQIEMFPIAYSSSEVAARRIEGYNTVNRAVSATPNKVSKISETGHVNDSVIYSGTFGEKTALRYTPLFNGVKEDIVLDENIGVNTFIFELNLNGLIPEKSGNGYNLLSLETDTIVSVINPIVINDSVGNICAVNNEMNIIHLHGTVYQLTITANKDFLNSMDTVYPVYIDPSITTPSNVISDTIIYNNNLTTDDSSGIIAIGNSSAFTDTSTAPIRSLAKFYHLTVDYKYNWSDMTINKIEYFVRHVSGDASNGLSVSAHMVTASTPNTLSNIVGSAYWNEFVTTPMSSKIIGTDGTDRNGTGSGDWYGFDISQAFVSWISGAYGGISYHYGIMLKASNESNSGVAFASAEYGSADYMPFLKFSFTVSGMETEGINENTDYRFRNTTSQKTMVLSALTSNTPLMQGDYTQETNFANLRFTYQGSGEYTISLADAPSMVLSVGSAVGDAYNSRYVGLYPNYNYNSQRWYIVLGDMGGETGDTSDTDTYYFVSKAYPTLTLSTNGSSAANSYLYVSENGNGIYWNISHLRMNVGTHTQTLSNSCGAASCKTVIEYLSDKTIDEIDFFESAGGGSTAPLLYQYTQQFNYEICGIENSNNCYYTYNTSIGTYTLQEYKEYIVKYTSEGYPLISRIYVENSLRPTFGYNLSNDPSGHYIVITGFEIDENGNMTIHYNDSYPYANIPSQPKRTVSLSDMYTVGKSGGFGMEWAWIQ